LDPWPLLDIAAPSMLVGQGIGRLGCLCNGDAWGADATGCPFCLAIRYTNQNDLLPANLQGVPTYAYPFYEIAAEALLLVALWLFRDRLRQRPGLTFLVGAIGYAIIRFALTFYRQERLVLWSLQEAQVIALVTGMVAFGFLVWRVLGRTDGARPAIV
jgi:phosphatidylglycerol:prolipoprotein diacylglycerol transferase